MNGIALHGGYHPVRRHVPDVLRLQPQRDAHGGADEAARRSSCSRTTRSASAKTARRTSRSSTLSSLRLIPNLDVWRPCDTVETAVAWARGARAHARPDGAAAIAPEPAVTQPRSDAQIARHRARRLRARRAGEVGRTQAQSCIATGSEVELALQARRAAGRAKASRVRVVSMPSTDVFDRQDARLQRERAAAAACRASRSRRA